MQTMTQPKTQSTRVIYSNTDRAYLLLDGKTVTGQYSSHQDAVMAQLHQAAPEALAIAQRIMLAYPDLATRALKAVELYANGNVFPAQKAGQYRILSQSGTGEMYSVQVKPMPRCGCYDALRQAPHWKKTRMCKHIIAVGIYQQLEAE